MINTDVTATGSINLTSRNRDVLFDDPTLTAVGDIELHRATITAGRDVTIDGHDVDVTESRMDAGRDVGITSFHNVLAPRTRLTADRDVKLKAKKGDVIANAAVLEAGREIEIKAEKEDVNVDFATLTAGREIEIESEHGNIDATRSL